MLMMEDPEFCSKKGKGFFADHTVFPKSHLLWLAQTQTTTTPCQSLVMTPYDCCIGDMELFLAPKR